MIIRLAMSFYVRKHEILSQNNMYLFATFKLFVNLERGMYQWKNFCDLKITRFFERFFDGYYRNFYRVFGIFRNY